MGGQVWLVSAVKRQVEGGEARYGESGGDGGGEPMTAGAGRQLDAAYLLTVQSVVDSVVDLHCVVWLAQQCCPLHLSVALWLTIITCTVCCCPLLPPSSRAGP